MSLKLNLLWESTQMMISRIECVWVYLDRKLLTASFYWFHYNLHSAWFGCDRFLFCPVNESEELYMFEWMCSVVCLCVYVYGCMFMCVQWCWFVCWCVEMSGEIPFDKAYHNCCKILECKVSKKRKINAWFILLAIAADYPEDPLAFPRCYLVLLLPYLK